MASPPTYSDALRDDDKQFVTLADCQYHASLLQTFNKLRIADPTLEKLYLARAETRYILWMNHIADTIQPDADILPPIGKWMIIIVFIKPTEYNMGFLQMWFTWLVCLSASTFSHSTLTLLDSGMHTFCLRTAFLR